LVLLLFFAARLARERRYGSLTRPPKPRRYRCARQPVPRRAVVHVDHRSHVRDRVLAATRRASECHPRDSQACSVVQRSMLNAHLLARSHSQAHTTITHTHAGYSCQATTTRGNVARARGLDRLGHRSDWRHVAWRIRAPLIAQVHPRECRMARVRDARR